MAGLAVGACALFAAAGIFILPVLGGVKLRKYRKKKRQRKLQLQGDREWRERLEEIRQRGEASWEERMVDGNGWGYFALY